MVDHYYSYRPHKKKSRFPLLIIFLFLVAIGVGAFFYWRYLLSPVDVNGQKIQFVVNKGEGVNSIAQRLESEHIIHSSLAFKIALKLSDNNKIEAGNFTLSSSLSTDQIIKSLRKSSTDKTVRL